MRTIIYDLPELWQEEQKRIIRNAANLIGMAFEPITGMEPEASFAMVLGVNHVRYSYGLQWGAHSTGNVIQFRHANFVTTPYLVHEYGHTLGRLAGNAPSKAVAAERIFINSASKWPGMHPITMQGGHLAAERWANLFEIWVMMLFADNDEGRRLRKWLDERMPGWIQAAMAKVALMARAR